MMNDLSAETKSDLVNFNSAQNHAGYVVLGDSTRSDSPARAYVYDSSSSATADGEDILSATGMGGTGRYLKNPDNTPTGTIHQYAGGSTPIWYLFCDGSAISRTTYAKLFGVTNTTFGIGDGSTTFNLPDLRQKFPLGKASSGTGSSLGDTGGLIDHVHSIDPPSTTTSSDGSHNHTGVTGSPSTTVIATNLIGSAASTTHTHSIPTDGAHTHTINMAAFNSVAENPPYLSLNYIIKF